MFYEWVVCCCRCSNKVKFTRLRGNRLRDYWWRLGVGIGNWDSKVYEFLVMELGLKAISMSFF